jgi:hypothetical protein
MRREDLAIAVLWSVILVILIFAVVVGLRETIDATSKIIVAVIGAAVTLGAAILTHAFTVLREQRLELQRQKQLNYAALVDKLAPFVRGPKEQIDEFTKAHLFSWVVGSSEVVERTTEFMALRSAPALKALLLAMRRDLGLPDTDAPLGPLFSPVDPPARPESLRP